MIVTRIVFGVYAALRDIARALGQLALIIGLLALAAGIYLALTIGLDIANTQIAIVALLGVLTMLGYLANGNANAG